MAATAPGRPMAPIRFEAAALLLELIPARLRTIPHATTVATAAAAIAPDTWDAFGPATTTMALRVFPATAEAAALIAAAPAAGTNRVVVTHHFVIETHVPGIRPGDMFLVNHPYKGSLHAPDFGLVAPVFHGDKQIAWIGVCCHQLDVGGMAPGGSFPEATDVLQEGVGLNNTRNRLLRLYGGNHRITFATVPAGGFEVTIRIPYFEGAPEKNR